MFYFYDPTIVMLFWVFLLIGGIGLLVFFILTLVAAMNCLDQCRRRNREMEPGMVWLSLIPLFGYVWSYFVVIRVEEALTLEYKSRGLRRPKDFGQPLGLAALICWHGGLLLCFIGIGILGIMASAGLFIPYWQGLTKFHKRLQETDRDERDDYDEDDRPRRRSRRDRDEEYDDFDDDEERPRSRRSRREDDDEEEDRPRRRRRETDEGEGGRRSPPPPPKPDSEGDWKK